MIINALRKKYPEFVYQNFSYEFVKPNLKIWFNFYIAPKLNFTSKITIKNCPSSLITKEKEDKLNNFIFHLGLIEMLNYWKLTCSPLIKIEAGFLNKKQISFLKKVILNGMGQYFYENKINFTKANFLRIKIDKQQKGITEKTANAKSSQDKEYNNRILVPIGGGKDAPVTIDILKKKNLELGTFILNARKPQLDIAKIANLKKMILVEREIDQKLFQMNKDGFLNGHVPFSAFLSFLGLLIAFVFDYKEVAFSWEKSSDQGNLKYKNKEINHQWSKSSEFEKMLNQYSKKYLSKDIKIYSPLRKMYELQIIKRFVKLQKYHSVFLSCNTAYKKGGKLKWCGKCPKCLFVFASLYPFLSKKELIRIFDKDLFEDESLIPLMEELVGERAFKPFDCVGTKEESLAIFYLGLKKAIKEDKKKIPALLKYFQKNILLKYPKIDKITAKVGL